MIFGADLFGHYKPEPRHISGLPHARSAPTAGDDGRRAQSISRRQKLGLRTGFFPRPAEYRARTTKRTSMRRRSGTWSRETWRTGRPARPLERAEPDPSPAPNSLAPKRGRRPRSEARIAPSAGLAALVEGEHGGAPHPVRGVAQGPGERSRRPGRRPSRGARGSRPPGRGPPHPTRGRPPAGPPPGSEPPRSVRPRRRCERAT